VNIAFIRGRKTELEGVAIWVRSRRAPQRKNTSGLFNISNVRVEVQAAPLARVILIEVALQIVLSSEELPQTAL
jgi:hypothetical protein